MTVHPTTAFSWNDRGIVVTGEVSQTPPEYLDRADTGEAYRVAGLAVRSNRTNRVAVFVVRGEPQRDAENEVMYWTLTPSAKTAHAMPELAGVTIRLFND